MFTRCRSIKGSLSDMLSVAKMSLNKIPLATEQKRFSDTMVAVLIAVSAISLLLTVTDRSIKGWISFSLLLLLGAWLCWYAFRLAQSEQQLRWLWMLMAAAVVLRLALGAFWFVVLPVYGWGSETEKAGYVFKDAYKRDVSAWELAHSQKSLFSAFSQDIRTDQYGGLLFLSAAVYRYQGGIVHQPLLMVVFSAVFSSLSILFTWAFVRLIVNARAAAIAAWVLALYPETMLLGSSQMREAYVMTFAAMAFYGLTIYIHRKEPVGVWWLVVSLLLCMLFSPPSVAMLVIALLMLAFGLLITRPSAKTLSTLQRLSRFKTLWLVFIIIILLTIIGLWLSWGQIAPKGITNIWGWWFRKATTYQFFLSHQDSGWLQREFRKLPDLLHFPALVFYGILRPFLPAAIVGYSNPVWYGIALWRSLGWTFFLLSIIYATLRLWLPPSLPKERRLFLFIVCLIVWLGIIIATYRGGGDDWDSPRYRVMFVSLQVGLVGWGWSEIKRDSLRCLAIATIFFLAWFFPWYIRRYRGLEWQVISIFHTVGLGIASAILYVIWDLHHKDRQ